jgi:hypothetical protein
MLSGGVLFSGGCGIALKSETAAIARDQNCSSTTWWPVPEHRQFKLIVITHFLGYKSIQELAKAAENYAA